VTSTLPRRRAERFSYERLEVDEQLGELRCHYSLDDRHFVERIGVGGVPTERWATPDARAAALWVFLLAGISYYKAGAPPGIDLGEVGITTQDLEFLRTFYVDGLGEYAYRNELDLSGLEIAGDKPATASTEPAVATVPEPQLRPLVPFGGGIDSIVTTELVRERAGEQTAVFVVSAAGDRFAAIEAAAAATRLPVIRAERALDPAIFREDLGFLNGHVPVTGIISAIAVLAAVLHGRDAVVMSNEASASSGNLVVGGRVVNHQWSKGVDFEEGFRGALARHGVSAEYFSMLRSASELWVAQRFAAMGRYHHVFRSCNRAFYVDPALRLDRWCGECDKCCFVDLVLAPFMERTELEAVFAGHEPLDNDSLADRFRTLLATSSSPKPFDCVGDTPECRTALRLTATRPDRRDSGLVHQLAAELPAEPADAGAEVGHLLRPGRHHFIPDAYAPSDLLV
jgi:UDP-N-acetyl-alpha-D-muramoyl-L-alanyl-L-glutamate epimerase